MDGKELHKRLEKIKFDLNKIDYVVFHKNCQDGFGSAWIVWRFLKGSATYKGIAPSNLPNPNIFKKKYVLFVDISLSGDYIDQVMKYAKNVLVIDHHNTYVDDMVEHPNAIHESDHSAIYITWRIFFPDQKIPQFVRYIEDNDLGNQSMKKTEPFVSAVGTKLPFHHIDYFKNWNKLLNPAYVDKLIQDGYKYQEYKNYLLKRNMHISVEIKLGKYKALVCNFGTVGLASDLGNRLADLNPDYDFVIMWNYHYNNEEYSVMLRSRNDRVDLSQIAKLYGGGGHPKASRFAWKNPIEGLWDDMRSKLKNGVSSSSGSSRKTHKKSVSKSVNSTKKIEIDMK